MAKGIAGVLGFFLGMMLCMAFYGILLGRGVDVFHAYIIKPTGIYRSPLDVPTADWPALLAFVVGIIFASLGASMAQRFAARSSAQKR